MAFDHSPPVMQITVRFPYSQAKSLKGFCFNVPFYPSKGNKGSRTFGASTALSRDVFLDCPCILTLTTHPPGTPQSPLTAVLTGIPPMPMAICLIVSPWLT